MFTQLGDQVGRRVRFFGIRTALSYYEVLLSWARQLRSRTRDQRDRRPHAIIRSEINIIPPNAYHLKIIGC
jgi:hypothetical protein